MYVEYKDKILILKFIICEFTNCMGAKDYAVLMLVDPLWNDFFKARISDMNILRMKLFASLSHELRTPLNCSISLLDLL